MTRLQAWIRRRRIAALRRGADELDEAARGLPPGWLPVDRAAQMRQLASELEATIE